MGHPREASARQLRSEPASLAVAALLGSAALAGCGGVDLDDFEGSEPRLVPETFFVGSFVSQGLFKDRFGDIRSQFTAEVEGRRDGDDLILDERFTFETGEQVRQVWRVESLGEGEYRATGNHVIGTARGRVEGQAFRLEYDRNLGLEPEEGFRTHFDHLLILQPNDVVFNLVDVTKYGFAVGEITAFFRRVEE